MYPVMESTYVFARETRERSFDEKFANGGV